MPMDWHSPEILEGVQTVFSLEFINSARQREFIKLLPESLEYTMLYILGNLVEIKVNNTIEDAEQYYFGEQGVLQC